MTPRSESAADEHRGITNQNRGLPQHDQTIDPRQAAQLEAARLEAGARYISPSRRQPAHATGFRGVLASTRPDGERAPRMAIRKARWLPL